MGWIHVAAVLLIVLLASVPGKSDPPKESNTYDDDYYYYDYEEQSEKTARVSVEPNINLESITSAKISHFGGNEFRAIASCTDKIMTLEVDRTLLPYGLGFFEDSIPESEIVKSGSNFTCTRLSHNKTHFIYEVALNCHHVVGELKYGTVTLYTHEVLLTDNKGKKNQSNSEVYSVVMECETESAASRGDKIAETFPEFRLYEHRNGVSCMASSCPHGDMCVSSAFIDGFFCTCPDVKCVCPTDFYGCSKGKNASVTLNSLMCIRNEYLCDKRFDCPLQDDELCTDVWTTWSSWSACSQTCGQGTQIRQRSCTNTFTQDPSRCSKKCNTQNAQENELDERVCDSNSCASVQCLNEAMLISIPMENGMSEESIQKRMRVKGTQECMPKINATHVLFSVPLHKCNTSSWVDGDSIFFTNEIVYETDLSPIIVREFGHSYIAKCQYSRRQTVGIRRFSNNPEGQIIDTAVMSFMESQALKDKEIEESFDMIEHFTSGDGEFSYKMDIYIDKTYAKAYAREDYPLQKRLGERMYVGVQFQSEDEDLYVFIEKCWAISSGATGISADDITYTFIEDGCPLDDTVIFHNDLSHFSDRFSIESFKFNDPDHWYVYFRCDVILCDVGDEDLACKRSCDEAPMTDNQKRKKRSTHHSSHTYAHVMQGPIIILDKKASGRPFRESNVGSIQHKVFTEERKDNFYEEHSNLLDSPLLVGCIVGAVCLLIGSLLGFTLRRKNTEHTEAHHEAEKFLRHANEEKGEYESEVAHV